MSSLLTKMLMYGRSVPFWNSFGSSAGILLHEVRERRADGRADYVHFGIAAGLLAKRGRNLDLDRH